MSAKRRFRLLDRTHLEEGDIAAGPVYTGAVPLQAARTAASKLEPAEDEQAVAEDEEYPVRLYVCEPAQPVDPERQKVHVYDAEVWWTDTRIGNERAWNRYRTGDKPYYIPPAPWDEEERGRFIRLEKQDIGRVTDYMEDGQGRVERWVDVLKKER